MPAPAATRGVIRAIRALFGDGIDLPVPATFRVPLVEQARYQASIALSRVGQPIRLMRERSSPRRSCAIVAIDDDDIAIGYLSHEAWLTAALLEDGAGCTARIAAIDRGQCGALSVILAVQLTDGPIGERCSDPQE